MAPTNLTASPRNEGATLEWDPVSSASTYNVYRAQQSGGPYAQVATVTQASYTDTGLTNGTTYYYVVTARSSGSESTYSAEASATAGPVTIVKDYFEETENTPLPQHSPDQAPQGSAWIETVGDMIIVANDSVVDVDTVGASTYRATWGGVEAVIEAGASDGVVESAPEYYAHEYSNRVGLICRWIDASNFILVEIYPRDGDLYINEMYQGTRTRIAHQSQDNTFISSSTVIRATLDGSAVQAKASSDNGTVTASGAVQNTTGTKHGIEYSQQDGEMSYNECKRFQVEF